MQDADEDRPLEGEPEAAALAFQETVHHRAQPQPFTEGSVRAVQRLGPTAAQQHRMAQHARQPVVKSEHQKKEAPVTKSDRKCERGLRFATVGDSMSDYELHARSDRLPRASVSGGAPHGERSQKGQGVEK